MERKKRKNYKRLRITKLTGPLLLAMTAATVLVLVVFVAFLSLSAAPEPIVPVASRFYDVNNQLITTVSVENRIELPLSSIPRELQAAFLAVEDARFYRHFGIDPYGIARAIFRNLKAGRIVQGASTITQLLARNVFLSHEETFVRKFKEIFLALQLERQYTKDQILEMFLNTIYFGNGAYGVEVAAQTFFGQSVGDLTLAEMAFLAVLPRGPSYYSPYEHFDRAKARQEVILNEMASHGYITADEAKAAKEEKIAIFDVKTRSNVGPYFIDYIVRYITDKYPDGSDMVYRQGLEVYTTMDLSLQTAADQAFAAGMPASQADSQGISQPQGALVAIDPKNGYVKALIGGRDFSKTKLNRATQSFRQPGSAFKPFVYTAAIDSGAFTAATIYRCEPTTFTFDRQIWEPTDYGDNPFHYTDLTLRDALRLSDNIVSSKLMEAITPAKAAEYAYRMGIKSNLRQHLSLVLGTSEVSPLEMAVAYCPLANGGNKVEPLFVLRIETRTGRVLEDNRPRTIKILDERTAYIVTDMLKGVIQPGGTASRVGTLLTRPAAGKTGSTNEYRDAWFVGYTPDIVVSVYAGHDDPATPVGRGGGAIGGPIFAATVEKGLVGVPASDFPRPAGIVDVSIDPTTGKLASPFCPQVRTELFLAGTEPQEICPLHNFFTPILPPGLFPEADPEPGLPPLEDILPDILLPPGDSLPPEDSRPLEPPTQGFAPDSQAEPGEQPAAALQPRETEQPAEQPAELPLDADSPTEPPEPIWPWGLWDRDRGAGQKPAIE